MKGELFGVPNARLPLAGWQVGFDNSRELCLFPKVFFFKNLHAVGIERHFHVGLGRHQAIFLSDFKSCKLLRTS